MVALVLLPGMDGTGTLFRGFISALGSRFETIVGSYPAGRALGYSDLELQARALLPIDRPFLLLGESFSGPIAIAVAASPPPGLIGLILCGSFARNPRRIFAAARPFFRLLPAGPVPARLLDMFLSFILRRFASPHLRAELKQALADVPAATLGVRIGAVLDLDISSRVSEIRVPILYLQGSDDWIVPRSCSRDIARAAPQTQIVEIEAPHFLLQTAPSAAAAAVTRFANMCSRSN